MKVLFLHPDDSPSAGAWSHSRWDLIVDLGFASFFTYAEWSRQSGARVLSIHQFAGQQESFRWVNQVIEHGRGRLFDRMGLDWWEILAVCSYQDLQALYLCNQLCSEINLDGAELAATREHMFTRIAASLSGRRVRSFESPSWSALGTASRMLRSARTLRPAQIVEVAFDKWDANYQVRRHLNQHKRARETEPVVVMPSAYSNVTRTALAYAAQLPHRQFLLATTRHSALPAQLTMNVATVPLAAYALPASASENEVAELKKAWEVFRRDTVSGVEELRKADLAGFWKEIPTHLEIGLRMRDAWKNLLHSEPVKGVLCGDDLNYHTRLPLLLAYRADLRAVYCSHGALDGGLLFKLPLAETFLVKGEMESDYLQRARSIEPKKIWIGAPGRNTYSESANAGRQNGDIVFFSQPYEVEGGRIDAIYHELLPRLYAVAERSGRKLVIKLHPFESRRGRMELTASILPKRAVDRIEILSQVPVEEVLSRTWCGISVDSSVAVECILKGIPFFLCGWFDFGGMGYLRQFARYGAGRILNAPEDIEQIPEMVAEYRTNPAVLQRLWREADPAKLDDTLFGRGVGSSAGAPHRSVSLTA